MIKFNSTSSVLIVASVLTLIILYFIGLTTPGHQDIIKFGYDTAFLVLILGFILRLKNIQQLIGIFLYIIVYNLDIINDGVFRMQSNDLLHHFINRYNFYILLASLLFLLPTLLDKYKFAPLTNGTNLRDSTIILTTITLTILIQTTTRLIL